MKKNLLFVVIIIVIITAGIFYYWQNGRIAPIVKSPEQLQLEKMTIEEKVGQMFMFGFVGTVPNAQITKMITERNIGGVILMKYNISDRAQLTALTSKLQTLSKIPLFIAVDQEGGIVSRLKFDGISELTAQTAITSHSQAYTVAAKRSQELKSVGINVNFSPVLDYITNPRAFMYERVFHGNPETVGEFGQAMVAGYSDSKIIAVPKHFLGHPDNATDPHAVTVTADFTQAELTTRAQIFKNALGGAPNTMVMSSHVTYTNIDSEKPCSLSPSCINYWLRNQSNFATGVVITDAMEMGAIQTKFKNAEAAVMAIQAGNDILLYASAPQKQIEAYGAVLEAVKNGMIHSEQVDASVLKILKLKNRLKN